MNKRLVRRTLPATCYRAEVDFCRDCYDEVEHTACSGFTIQFDFIKINESNLSIDAYAYTLYDNITQMMLASGNVIDIREGSKLVAKCFVR